ncbi:hypothetical protein CcI49_08535 [Frankia sp. CcI49]|nr:hypothetical protein CcI49_08535 [Frankia sp. CcI49]
MIRKGPADVGERRGGAGSQISHLGGAASEGRRPRILPVTHHLPPEIGAPRAHLGDNAGYQAGAVADVAVLIGMSGTAGSCRADPVSDASAPTQSRGIPNGGRKSVYAHT